MITGFIFIFILYRRPDTIIRNPYGGGPQEVVEVIVSSFNNQNRTNNNRPEQVLITSEKQKTKKYGKAAEQNHLRLCPAAFSTTGEMGPSIKKLFLEQIRLKLQLVDGEVKRSKVQKIMKHCVRHISAAINRSASRNIFLKAKKIPWTKRNYPQIP